MAKYVCDACGWEYDEELGSPENGIARAQKLYARAAGAAETILLHNGSTLAVTGGSTMAATARYMQSANPLNVMVVPARGGMGRSVAYQANTLAAEIAQRLGGHHRLIHLPDRMDAAAMQEMLKVPGIQCLQHL